jgi:hypothetical protein
VRELAETNSDILEPDRKKQTESLVFVAKQQVTRNKIDKIILGKIVRQHQVRKNQQVKKIFSDNFFYVQSYLPLEFLWMLHSAEILNFSLYIAG